MNQNNMHGTTILCVRKNVGPNKWEVVMGGDGQVSMGNQIRKGTAVKVRKIGPSESPILVGFAGSTADAVTMLETLNNQIKQHPTLLEKACLVLAAEWRKSGPGLDALLLVADNCGNIFLVSGKGDVISADQDAIAIGSGGAYAESSALAMLHSAKILDKDIPLKVIVKESLLQAAKICVFTNEHITILDVETKQAKL